MKEEIVKFVASVVRQREFLLKNKKSNKNQLKCYAYCKQVKCNLIGRSKLTEIAAKKIFLKFQNEILFLIPSGNNVSFKKTQERYEKILNHCISLNDTYIN